MQDAILYVILFQAVAAVELFAVAAFQACLPAPRRNPRFMWVTEPLPAHAEPDASNQDFAESYDEAA
jgi:hypothetical protein